MTVCRSRLPALTVLAATTGRPTAATSQVREGAPIVSGGQKKRVQDLSTEIMAIYGPMIYMAPYKMLLIKANPLRG